MATDPGQKNGHRLELVRGGLDARGRRRSMKRTAKEVELDERMQRPFRWIGTTSRGVQRIQDGESKPWRSTGRRALELHADGFTPREIKALLVGELLSWIDELGEPLKPAA